MISRRRSQPRSLRYRDARTSLRRPGLSLLKTERVRPQLLNTLVLVKPATVIRWHRKGFRIYGRRRSRCAGRPKTSAGIRVLIRRMGLADPLWGVPRIHGELLKLGIEIVGSDTGAPV
jgi:hypothetical protein